MSCRLLQARDDNGALIAAVILSGRTLAPLAQIGSLFGRIHGARMAYKQVDEFMEAKLQEEDAKDYFSSGERLAS